LLQLTPKGIPFSRDEESKDSYKYYNNNKHQAYQSTATGASMSTLDITKRYFSASIPHKDHNNSANTSTSTTDKPDGGGGEMRTRRDRIVKASQLGAERGKAMAKQGAITTYQKLETVQSCICFDVRVTLSHHSVIYLRRCRFGTIDPVTMFSYINSITTGAHDALGGDMMGGTGESVEDGMAESKTTAHMVIEYLQHYSFTRPVVPFLEKNPHFANLGVAWVATKFTEPVRFGRYHGRGTEIGQLSRL
jgi:hypothetical protein